uniref:ABC-2 type transporter transmembrane domain-containing protein n=1 Tax=Oryza barthii TaxID=65489 RepID=A0A0D3GN85_9ORYZ
MATRHVGDLEAAAHGGGRFGFTGGLEFTGLTYTVTKKQRGAGGEWEKKEVDLLHEVTGYAPKGCVTAGTRGVSGGERRRVSIGVDIIHGPALLFLDEPTSGLDSTSAHSVVEKVRDIACAGSTVVLTIHQPSSRILQLLDHLVILARGQLMYSGAPREVAAHLGRMGRRVPKGESSIEHLLDVIQEYDQSEFGVAALAEFCLTGLKPPKLAADGISTVSSIPPTPLLAGEEDFDHSLRSQHSRSPWSGAAQFTPSRRPKKDPEIVMGTPTPLSMSAYTVSEGDYRTPPPPPRHAAAIAATATLGGQRGKFANTYGGEVWVLMRRNFTNIWRTPELFLSRLMVLVAMGVLMATMFTKPRDDDQGVTERLSFFVFTVCVLFFSSNDAVPAFIQERFIFIRETSHNAYRASAYVVAGVVTYLPFLLLQSAAYAAIVWFALRLHGQFLYFLVMLYASLLSTNSFVVFISSVVPNFILGYAAVIAFTALFFLFCGYFLDSHSIPVGWKWMNTISTMKYPYEGLLMNEFQGGRVFSSHPPPAPPLTGDIILEHLKISTAEDRKWWMVLYLMGWAVFYRVLFYLVLRFASKNKRK